jgi:alkanesulfonate monooxygenase SsuD/methylene tetrahydromethanopterin reductase-like flavin-dependent oxidoreductase (luciferase family)
MPGYRESLPPTARAMLDHVLQYSAIGTGADVARGIDAFVASTGVDEVIVASSIFDHQARKRSLSITADAVMKVAA